MSDDQLKNLVLDRLFADETVPDDVQMIVMAALASDDDLSSVLSETATPSDVTERLEAHHEASATPTGTFLRSLTVQGFRGIGEKVKVTLPDGPGLVVIAGRNGSGKSSLAEALEIALTGVNSRWAGKDANKLFSSAWRNLHVDAPPMVQLTVTEVDSGVATISTEWPDPDAPVTEAVRTVERPGAKRAPVDDLGWSTALELYRPLLSYDELGSILEGRPLEFYLQLFKLLGLEQLTAATMRLDAEVKRLQEPEKAFSATKLATKQVLADIDDPQARALAKEINRQSPPVDIVRARVAAGVVDAIPAAWRSAAALVLPERDRVTSVAGELRAAAVELEAQNDLVDRLAADQLQLLSEALDFHRRHGVGVCPVCGSGDLDDDWAQRTRDQVEASRRESAGRASVQDRAKRARAAVVTLIEQVPAIPQDANLTADDARTARETLRAVPLDDDQALAAHLESAWAVVTPAYAAVVQQAEQLIDQRTDVWAPAIQTLALWVEAAEQYVATEDRRSLAEKAQKWLKNNAEMLRNERLAPIAQQSARIWAALRQESNVELGNIVLAGQGNHRRVELLATVDGTPTDAFSVMSQGELHALALAIFLPRATAPASPFRFVVLDDPIQAMDPSKIEGFLDVLNEIARTHQVVVLTHDDRLPSAIRRRQQAARLFEVTRGSLSEVTVKDASRPAQRMLDDADALLKDENISATIKRRTVPVLCRNAVEQTSWEVFVHRALGRGRDMTAIEDLWHSTPLVKARVGLALGLEGQALQGWLFGHRAHAMHTINTGVHEGTEDVREALNKVRATVTDLRAVMT